MKFVSALALVLPVFVQIHAAEYFPPPDTQGGWRTATNTGQARGLAAMDAAWLEHAYQVCERGTQNGGLAVVRNGYLVFEKYFGRASRNISRNSSWLAWPEV